MVMTMPMVGMTVTMMMVVHMVGIRHRHFRTMTVRTTRVSVMHATTQQCVKHYRSHRGDRKQISEHGRFGWIRATGITGTVVLSTHWLLVYTET